MFYLDPPYVHSVRGDTAAYGYEMTDSQHRELAAALRSVRGRAVLSGYRNALYDEAFGDWRRVDAPERLCRSAKTPRRESLWLNF